MNPSGRLNVATLSGTLDASVPFTELRLPDGQIRRIETLLLLAGAMQKVPLSQDSAIGLGVEEVIPLIEEQLVIGKQTVETGKVRLIKTVTEYQEQLNEPLAVRTFDIERVVVNQPVEVAPGVRQNGLTTIYPVVEEQLVITKRLILKEEVHVTLRDSERIDTQVVTLAREHLTVEHEDLRKTGQ